MTQAKIKYKDKNLQIEIKINSVDATAVKNFLSEILPKLPKNESLKEIHTK